MIFEFDLSPGTAKTLKPAFSITCVSSLRSRFSVIRWSNACLSDSLLNIWGVWTLKKISRSTGIRSLSVFSRSESVIGTTGKTPWIEWSSESLSNKFSKRFSVSQGLAASWIATVSISWSIANKALKTDWLLVLPPSTILTLGSL